MPVNLVLKLCYSCNAYVNNTWNITSLTWCFGGNRAVHFGILMKSDRVGKGFFCHKIEKPPSEVVIEKMDSSLTINLCVFFQTD